MQLHGLVENTGLDLGQAENFKRCLIKHFDLFRLLLHDCVSVSAPILRQICLSTLLMVLLAHPQQKSFRVYFDNLLHMLKAFSLEQALLSRNAIAQILRVPARTRPYIAIFPLNLRRRSALALFLRRLLMVVCFDQGRLDVAFHPGTSVNLQRIRILVHLGVEWGLNLSLLLATVWAPEEAVGGPLPPRRVSID